MLKIKSLKSAGLVMVTFTALLSFNIKIVSAQEKPAFDRTILLENKVELPSNNVNAKVIRVTFPPAFKTPWHTHEGPGPRYVVKGNLKVVEEGKANAYAAGDVFWESGNLMSVENLGQDSAELIIFELVPVK